MKSSVFIVFLILLVGCSNDGFKSKVRGYTFASSAGTTELLPPTDKLDANCMQKEAYDACIFNKNPVYHQGRALDSQATSALEGIQTLGVKLTSLSSSGFLENATVSIKTLSVPRLLTADRTKFKVRMSQSNQLQIEQLMAYYYATRAVEYLSSRGPLQISNQGISIFIDDEVTGWRRADKSIHLSQLPGKLGGALDASQLIYLLGQANADLAISLATEANHKTCAQDPKGCCTSSLGCSRAIVSGAGTYFVAMMFPQAPIIGELSSNQTTGVRLCSVADRNVTSAKNWTATSSFSMCNTRTGDVNIAGTLYASIWWEIRQKASDSALVDRLFLEHLSRLSQADNFSTAKAKILSLDVSLNGSSLSQIISEEFARRGL